ncbi:MAG: hypothetical protein ACFFD4_02555 [Candidatus Odinarchaeota archaeon]
MTEHEGLTKGSLLCIESENGDRHWGFFDRFQLVKKRQFLVLDASQLEERIHFPTGAIDVGMKEIFVPFTGHELLITYPDTAKEKFLEYFLKNGPPSKTEGDNSFT